MRKKKIKFDIVAESIIMIFLVLMIPIAISSLQPEIMKSGEIRQNSIVDSFANSFIRVISFFDMMPSVAALDFGCCHGVISDACRMTTYDACVAMGGLPWEQDKICDDTNFCEQICCYNSNDGYCEKNTPRWLCQERGGQNVGGADCDVNVCKKGCCFLQSGRTVYNTEHECSLLEGNWDSNIEEYECSLQGTVFDEGCCVIGATCLWTTSDDCPEGHFYKDTYCSSLTEYCDCDPHGRDDFGCYKDKLDVYWFDSCGNPEQIKESCDYFNTGRKCVNGICQEGNCEVRLPNNERQTIKNGESICVYDQKITNLMDDPVLDPTKNILGKFGLDVAGSRHWRWICVDGELQIEPCADYRQQVCVDGSVNVDGYSFREAVCVQNMWADCFEILTEDECKNAGHGQCFWFAEDSDIKDALNNLKSALDWAEIPQEIKDKEFEEYSGFENEVGGNEDWNMPKCLPKYAPAYDQEDNQPLCALGSYSCFVSESKGGIFGEWTCDENCECGAYGVDGWEKRENYWLETMARRCSALGDCGLRVNIKERFTSGDTSSDLEEILESPGIVALRYDAKWDDADEDEEVDEDEVERKDEVDLVKLYAGIWADTYEPPPMPPGGYGPGQGYPPVPPDIMQQTTVINNVGQNELSIKKLIDEIKDYNIYSLEASGITGSAIKIDNFVGMGMLAFIGFVLGIPSVSGQETAYILKLFHGVDLVGTGGTTAGTGITLGGAIKSVLVYGGKGALVIAAAIAAGLLTYHIAKLLGLPPELAESLGWGAGAGVGLWLANTLFGLGIPGVGWVATGAAILIALLAWLFWAKRHRTIAYEFQCLPYQSPDGGHDCQECNNDPSRPCSEYRCLSLGAACNFTCEKNKDDECAEGVCYWTNPGDTVSPKIEEIIPITAHNVYSFTPGPPAGGADIRKDSTGNCINPFETITLNVKTNEPAQCKIDYTQTTDYDSMNPIYIGPEGNPTRHDEDHILTLQLIEVYPQFNIYVRCKDMNGNKNTGQEFKINFCSTQTDFAVPEILWINPESGAKISLEKTEVNVTLATNEPVEGCKWDTQEELSYGEMTNRFICEPNLAGSRCDATLPFDGIVTNFYYFKCNDTSGNFHLDPVEYKLIPTEPLNITDAQPNGTIGGCEQITKVNLSVITADGCCNGNAECFYKSNGDYIRFSDTGYTLHKHEIEIYPNIIEYNYYIVCLDKDGNSADATISFNVERDLTAPKLTRIYKSGGSLFIRTDEDATCSYHYSAGRKIPGCDFAANDTLYAKFFDGTGGTEHSISWDDEPWYVKCYDECGNGWQKSLDCLAVIYPSDFD